MTNPSTSRISTHRLYTVKGEGNAARWIDIGAAWQSRDAQGFTLMLDALPIDGRVVMRTLSKAENGGQP